MAIKDSTTLKSYFNLTKVPTPSNYVDLIDTIFDQGQSGGGGDHDHDDRYIQLSIPNIILAVHTFSPSVYGPPFILGSNAQSQTVIGLKADQLNKNISVSGLGLSGGGILTDNRTITLASSSNPGVAQSILATDTSGILTLARLKTEVLSDSGITGSILINPTGDISLDPGGNDVLPVTNYKINLGTLNKKYLTLHAAELWVETLVAHDTLATIGGRILVAPTTTLTRDLLASSTTFYVKHNELLSDDIVYLEANGKVEFILIENDGLLQGEGDYVYLISRNLDGSGANDWYAGDAVLNTGVTGDGYIDIYSKHSIRSGTQYGPTVVGNIRTGATYSDLIEGWAIGNLNGLYGYGVDVYGAAFGEYLSGKCFITIEPTNGIRFISRSGSTNTVQSQWSLDGTLTIGEVAASKSNIQISAGVINFRTDTTVNMNISTAGAITVGPSAAGNVYVTSSGVALRYGSTIYINLDTSGNALFGLTGTSKANAYWNVSNSRLEFRTDTTVKSYIDTDGGLVVKDPGGGMFERAAAVTWNDGTNDIGTIGSFSGGAIIGLDLSTKPITGKQSTLTITAEGSTTYSGVAAIRAKVGSVYSQLQLSVDGSTGDRHAIISADAFYVGSSTDPCVLEYTGPLRSWRSTGLEYDTWPIHPLQSPLTSSSWDGDGFSTTSKTLIDLSAVFSAPPGIKFVIFRVEVWDATAGDYWIILSPNDTSYEGPAVGVQGLSAGAHNRQMVWVPCNADGDVYYQIAAQGSGTFHVNLQIWGYGI